MPQSVGYDAEMASLEGDYRSRRISYGEYRQRRGEIHNKYFPPKIKEKTYLPPPGGVRYPYGGEPFRSGMMPSEKMMRHGTGTQQGSTGMLSPFADLLYPASSKPATSAPPSGRPATGVDVSIPGASAIGAMEGDPKWYEKSEYPEARSRTAQWAGDPRRYAQQMATQQRDAQWAGDPRRYEGAGLAADATNPGLERSQGLAMSKPNPSVSPFSVGVAGGTSARRALGRPASTRKAAAGATPAGGSGGKRSMYQATSIDDSYNRMLSKTFLAAGKSATKNLKSGINLFFAPVMDYRRNHMYFVRADGTRHMVDLNTSEGMDKIDVALAKTGFVKHYLDKGLDEDSARKHARMGLMDWARQNSSHLEPFLDPNMQSVSDEMPGMQPTDAVNEILGRARSMSNPDELEALVDSLMGGGQGLPSVPSVSGGRAR